MVSTPLRFALRAPSATRAAAAPSPTRQEGIVYRGWGIVLGIVCALTVAGCAKRTALPPPTITTGSTSTATGASRQQEIRTTATVQSVDLANRLVTLRRSDGETVTVRAGEQVRNLQQVKRGDLVTVVSYAAIAFQVLAPGARKPSVSANTDVLVAPLGEKPRGGTVEETTLVAKIVKLDRAGQQAVLRGPEGKRVTVDVHDPANFDKVKGGDTVAITFTEAYAIEVQPAL